MLERILGKLVAWWEACLRVWMGLEDVMDAAVVLVEGVVVVGGLVEEEGLDGGV